jgi:hypothetical protein
VPELNLQAMEALTKANEVRLCRAQDKDLIRRGKLDPLAILELPPDHWRTAKVIDVLLAGGSDSASASRPRGLRGVCVVGAGVVQSNATVAGQKNGPRRRSSSGGQAFVRFHPSK